MHKKIISFFTTFVFLSLITTTITRASDFETDAHVSYAINEDGMTVVKYDITVENTSEKALQKGYDLILWHSTPSDIVVTEDNKPITPELKGTDSETHIIIHFEKLINGEGNKKSFSIRFVTDSFVKKSGDIREVLIPKLLRPENFRVYDVVLTIPNSFGEEAYITPKAHTVSEEDNGKKYTFTKSDLLESGVQATFGKFQVYDLNLMYHLKNDSWKFTDSDIALPPDTALQKIYFDNLLPEAKSLSVDEDGNWIAHFSLWPKEEKDITFKGKALVFANPRRLLAPHVSSLLSNTKETQYWQTNDPEIQTLAQKLKTPEAIYRYVVSTLSYNYDRANPEFKRLGAVTALKEPTNATCMEFTDLFIALSRAAGIPAREVEGFAQSENPKVQPLSLYADVLHSWPEYWDSSLETWISVDPTWEKTTGGQDYFNTFDMKHVAFVIHGEDDTVPYPAGAYKGLSKTKKDVYVSISKLDSGDTPHTNLSYKRNNLIPFSSNAWTVTITNTSKVALYNQDIVLIEDQVPSTVSTLETLLPHQVKTISFTTPVGLLGKSLSHRIIIQSGNTTMVLPQDRLQVILFQLLAILIPFGMIGFIGWKLYLRTRNK